jgi:hypothetical protein
VALVHEVLANRELLVQAGILKDDADSSPDLIWVHTDVIAKYRGIT